MICKILYMLAAVSEFLFVTLWANNKSISPNSDVSQGLFYSQ